MYHSSPIGGHAGDVKIYLRIAAEWFWMGLRKDVSAYVQQCEVCRKQKVSQQAPAGLLQPLLIPNRVWEDINLDFIEGLPMSYGVDSILVIVDRFSAFTVARL